MAAKTRRRHSCLPRRDSSRRSGKRGSALLAVLWLAAALAAIAFAVANTVRGETERTSTEVDSMRAYYLATGAVDRALLWMIWGPAYRNPDGTPRYFVAPMPLIHYEFPTGAANVEIIPESSKLDINNAPPAQLMALTAALGIPPERAQMIVSGILDWRSHTPGGAFTGFDQYYLSLAPTFRARHASFEEIEEMLVIRGMTPELFYGRYDKAPDGTLLPRPGLKDCLSVYGGSGVYDVNTVQPAVMVALGVPPESAALIAATRRQAPFRVPQQFASIPGTTVAHIGLGGSPVVTVRATAAPRLAGGRLSDLRRSVSALVAFLPNQSNPPYHILRWYENAVAVQ
jgi:general secretion pathway protein K